MGASGESFMHKQFLHHKCVYVDQHLLSSIVLIGYCCIISRDDIAACKGIVDRMSCNVFHRFLNMLEILSLVMSRRLTQHHTL